MRPEFIIGGIVAALLIIAAITFWPAEDEPSVPAADPPATEEIMESPDAAGQVEPPASIGTEVASPDAEPEALPEPEPVEVLPALALSDDWVREALAGWPLPAQLLEREALLARLVVVLVNASEGGVAHREVAFLAPPEAFRAIEFEDDRYVLDPVSYRRYDAYMDALEAVPAEDLAGFLRRAEPLLIAALAQLGEARAPEELVHATLARIDALPELPARIELVRPNVLYLYADPALEGLPAFEKQVLRVGPRNLARLNRYLIDFSRHYF